ncbi:MAG TPA: DUF2892 domain-containing protein [Oligoflexus sp.]|uniref:YgaP family membrane protein n=1 Tax=Oligoflexus sp. TaxID=1971216 RepID=UPI002D4AB4D8|nr:DUF2892 domain-containing protein [Oligoflexus sp.]HYX32637.1 DUF2892 domain-containing protein [Oligoflexus sp.]
MQPNLSNQERLASVTAGTLTFFQGFSRPKTTLSYVQRAAGFLLVVRGLVGYCPVFRSLHRRPLHPPHNIERSIVIDRSVEEVRSILDEGDPLLHETSRKIFPITAGYLLWNLQLEPIGEGRLTHVRATLSEQNDSFELTTYLSKSVLKSLADTELLRIKQLIESDGRSELKA